VKTDPPRPGIFVTGTDTGVGKTVASAVLMTGLEADYWKPIQCGSTTPTDREWVREQTGLPPDRFHPETYTLTQPLSPHAAAELDGVRIELSDFELPRASESRPLIVEGAGGIMVPLNGSQLMIDLMKALGLPVVLVARSTLGTINHTLMSLDQLRRAGLGVPGVILNGPRNEVNREAIERFGGVRTLGWIPPLAKIGPGDLERVFEQQFSSLEWIL